MKKRSSKVVVALILAMTMLMGMSMTVMAEGPVDHPECTCKNPDHENHEYLISHSDNEVIVYAYPDNEFYTKYYYNNHVWELYYGTTPKIDGAWYYYYTGASSLGGLCTAPAKPSSHTHNYEWNTLVDPTTEQDGVEAYICSCGDIQATQPISAAHHILKVNADAVKNAKAGANVVVELGRLNSLPRWFVTKLVERDDLNVTLKITYNHENYTLEVPTTATIEDESIEWYGPLKLMSMFPQK